MRSDMTAMNFNNPHPSPLPEGEGTKSFALNHVVVN